MWNSRCAMSVRGLCNVEGRLELSHAGVTLLVRVPVRGGWAGYAWALAIALVTERRPA